MSIGDQDAWNRFMESEPPQSGSRSRQKWHRKLGIPEWLVLLGAVATLVGVVVLRPTGVDRPNLADVGVPSQFIEAVVVDLQEGECEFLPDSDCDRVVFELREGPDQGLAVVQELYVTETTPEFETGDRVVMSFDPEADPDFRYRFADRQRRSFLWTLGAVLVVAVLALGARHGAGALAGLGASLVVLLAFVLPALVDGRPPLPVALVGASLIGYLALYITHGFRRLTTLALLGTLASLGLTAVLSTLAVNLAAFSGLASEESIFLTLLEGQIDFRGLVLAGIVLGTLGALDDVTVTQASAVGELRAVNPDMSTKQLFRSGLRIGRDHVAASVNTLVLAYAGAALPLLLLFVLSNQSLGDIANGEVIAVEIVRSLVGSLGLVAAVPITTWLAAYLGGIRSQASEPAP